MNTAKENASNDDTPKRVSVHGGHSGAYCSHARDSLEDVVRRYIELGFEWICLTEHMPTENPRHVPVEESGAGYDVVSLQRRFDDYFAEARRLADAYRSDIDILVGFETEGYSGYRDEVAKLIARLDPDVIVGSVHHVHDLLIDATQQDYRAAMELSGSIEGLYCDYFDIQLELIDTFKPAIVGHFDLIRIHDPDYFERWRVPAVRDRVVRNLERIRDLGLILDLNVRAFAKGAGEPYPSAPWLRLAVDYGIAIVPGDDSHGVASVGRHIDDGVRTLIAAGGTTRWPRPALRTHTR